LDSVAFLNAVEEKLAPISPMAKLVIDRQLQEMGLSREMLSPKQAEMLMRRVVDGMTLFAGPSGAKMAKNIMLRELRKRAPSYFASLGL
jgi:hypothetical protein